MPDERDRAYLVMGTDQNGDHDLFATDNLPRAEDRFRRMRKTHADVRANWKSANAPTSDGHH